VDNLAETFGDSFAGGIALKALADPVDFALAVTGGQAVNHTRRFLAPATTAASRQVDGFINMRLRLAAQLWGEDGYYLRPLTELNFSEVYAGGFHETGAGPLNLVVPESIQSSGSAGLGFEFGGETAFDGGVLRPFIGYEIKNAIFGRSQSLMAELEGAPSGVGAFSVSNSPDLYLHQATAGFDIITNDNWNLRFLYTGTFGRTTRQDLYSLKIAIPF
jgi:hypothetical protein